MILIFKYIKYIFCCIFTIHFFSIFILGLKIILLIFGQIKKVIIHGLPQTRLIINNISKLLLIYYLSFCQCQQFVSKIFFLRLNRHFFRRNSNGFLLLFPIFKLLKMSILIQMKSTRFICQLHNIVSKWHLFIQIEFVIAPHELFLNF